MRSVWIGDPPAIVQSMMDAALRALDAAPDAMRPGTRCPGVAALVSRGLGIAIVPDWSPPWPEGLHLRKLPLRGDRRRVVGVLRRRSGPRIAAIRAFVEPCGTVCG